MAKIRKGSFVEPIDIINDLHTVAKSKYAKAVMSVYITLQKDKSKVYMIPFDDPVKSLRAFRIWKYWAARQDLPLLVSRDKDKYTLYVYWDGFAESDKNKGYGKQYL